MNSEIRPVNLKVPSRVKPQKRNNKQGKLNKTKGGVAGKGLDLDLSSDVIQPLHLQNEIEETDGLPSDHVDVSVDAGEERAFLEAEDKAFEPFEDEEVVLNDKEVDTVTHVDSEIDFRFINSSDEVPTDQASGDVIVSDSQIPEDFEKFRGNPAFECYLQKRMSEEVRQPVRKTIRHKTTPKKR